MTDQGAGRAPTPTKPTHVAARQGAANAAQAGKVEALRRLTILKKGATAASMLGFLMLSGIIMAQHTATSSTTSAQVASSPAQGTAGSASQSTSSQNGFFSQGQGDYSFGNTTTPQAPMAGSGVS